MDIRKEQKGLGEVFRMLSKTSEGRLHLSELTKIKENGLEMLKHMDLLPIVIGLDVEDLICEVTLAHCLAMSGHEEVQIGLSKMPAEILELKTKDGDKVVEFLIAHSSVKVREALAENVDALKIICLDLLSDSGEMSIFGVKSNVVDPKEVKNLKDNSVAHVLLYGNPSDAVVKKIALAPKEVLALVNGEGTSVEQLLKRRINPHRSRSKC